MQLCRVAERHGRRRVGGRVTGGGSHFGVVVVVMMKNNQNAALCLTESQTAPSRGQRGTRVGVVRVIFALGEGSIWKQPMRGDAPDYIVNISELKVHLKPRAERRGERQ